MSRLILWFTMMWIITLSSVSLAQNNNCNWFWAKCNVNDINTIHTNDDWPNANLLTVIKNAINWCLGILATVVLCFCMYWWFKMLTSWTDSKWYEAGRKILKNALIWLAIIALAWMIVSVVFWFIAVMSGSNQTQSAPIESVSEKTSVTPRSIVR